MNSANEQFRRKLEELRISYVKALPQRRKAIRDAYRSSCEAGNIDSALSFLSALRSEAHKIAGSAGSFGYSTLTNAARHLENECDSRIKARQPFNFDEVWCLSSIIQSIDLIIERAADQPRLTNRAPRHIITVIAPDRALFDRLKGKLAGCDLEYREVGNLAPNEFPFPSGGEQTFVIQLRSDDIDPSERDFAHEVQFNVPYAATYLVSNDDSPRIWSYGGPSKLQELNIAPPGANDLFDRFCERIVGDSRG